MEMIIEHCTLCPRSCGTRRDPESGSGFCRAGTLPRIAAAQPHFWEEPCLSGTRGSGAIFFSGCTLSCVYCQNTPISREGVGKTISVEALSEKIRQLEAMGVHNINFVSPTPYVDAIIEALRLYRPAIPVVYNTSGYETPETLRRLEGLVDIYLPDLKYIRSDLSRKYSGAADYAQRAIPAIEEMVRQTGAPRLREDGLMEKGTIIRHLILPQNTRNSLEVLKVIKERFDRNVLVSLMGQYLPCGQASLFPELSRRITKREYEKVLFALYDLSLDGYAQELSSAKKEYIPDFDPSAL